MAQCPSCGSTNVAFQREQNVTGGVGKTTYKVKGKHGILWWCLIGIWWRPIMWMVSLMTLGLVGRRKKGQIVGTTVNASKTFNRTMAICQNCGRSWTV